MPSNTKQHQHLKFEEDETYFMSQHKSLEGIRLKNYKLLPLSPLISALFIMSFSADIENINVYESSKRKQIVLLNSLIHYCLLNTGCQDSIRDWQGSF